MQFPYHLVDVFTETPFEGNALAVFSDAAGLNTATMQRVARELNLSETTFIFPGESSDARTRVRIFTPTYEMQFAGHPTIGTAYVMRELGIVPKDAKSFVLSENVGDVPVRVEDGHNARLWLTTPTIQTLGEYPRDRCAAALSLDEADLLPIPCQLLSAGNPNIYVAVRDHATVDRAQLDVQMYIDMVSNRDDATCIFVFAATASGAYSRMFAPQLGIIEDPATGSAMGPLAAFMMAHGLASRNDGAHLINEQGTKMGRRSILHALIHGLGGVDGIEVGGHVTSVAKGEFTIRIPALTAAD